MNQVLQGDAVEVIKNLQPDSIDLCFTSPTPFYEGNQADYELTLSSIFKEVKRVLKLTGSFWLQLADNHTDGVANCTPESVMFLLMNNGWILRSKCIWIRTEKFDYQEDYARFARDWEYLFFFTKSKEHFFNNPKNKVQSSIFAYPYLQPKSNTFESGFPEKMIERCINLSCPKNGVILDPLADSGTTGVVAKRMGRKFIMVDISYDKVLAMRGRLGVQ